MENFKELWAILIRKTLPFAVIGLGIGEFFVFRVTGKIDIILTICLIFVFSFLAFLISFFLSVNRGEGEHAKLKTIFDVLSLIFMVIFLATPWWLYLSAHQYVGQHRMPLPLIVFMADGLPFIAGSIWVAVRYVKKYPRLFSRWIIFTLIFMFIFIPIILMKNG